MEYFIETFNNEDIKTFFDNIFVGKKFIKKSKIDLTNPDVLEMCRYIIELDNDNFEKLSVLFYNKADEIDEFIRLHGLEINTLKLSAFNNAINNLIFFIKIVGEKIKDLFRRSICYI